MIEEEDLGDMGKRVPDKIMNPKLPSKEEIEEHYLQGHLPYRAWCSHCVRGKGKRRGHRCQEDKDRAIREIHVDYCFMGMKGEESTKTIVVAKDRDSGMVMSSVVPMKGASSSFAAKRIRAFAKELGQEHTDLTLKGDQEAALQDLLQETARIRAPAKTFIEQSPVGESESNGVAERGIQTIEGEIRVLKDAFEARVEKKLRSDDNILAWLVEYAGVVVNRFEVGHDGKTPYERLRGKRTRLLGLEFGELQNFRRSPVPGRMAKFDSLWSDGVFLGYRSASGEIIVGTKEGVVRTRTVKRKAEEERWTQNVLDMVGGVPWAPSAGDASAEVAMPDIIIPMQEPEVEVVPARAAAEGVATPRRLAIRVGDIHDHGATAGCKGCVATLRGARGVPHTEACRTRLTKAILEGGGTGRDRAEAANKRELEFYEAVLRESDDKRRKKDGAVKNEVAQQDGERDDHGQGSKRKAEEPLDRDEIESEANGGESTRMIDYVLEVPCKEGHEEEMAGEAMDELEEKDCGFGREPQDCEDGERYYDDRTGRELDAKKVKAAREEELQELERRVYVKVPIKECWEKKGKAPIQVRWVNADKGFGQVRSRLVAKDFKPKTKADDVGGMFAGTPPLEAIKMVIMHAAVSSRRGNKRKVMFIDIKKAHLYAPMVGEEYVDLPPERAEEGMCAKLLYTLYGMRVAASNWEREYSSTLAKAGLQVGRASSCTFFEPVRGLRIVVHGDDFVIEGEEEDLRWVESVLEAKYLVKMRGILGPDQGDCKVMDILGRVVEWREDELWYEADPRQVEKMLTEMGMDGCNGGAVPGVRDEGEHECMEEELGPDERRLYRSVVARGNYLAQDRPDIRFSVKELCRGMARPTQRDWRKLRKLCRYLRGRPRLVQKVEIEGCMDGLLHVYVDSDWAGCRESRKSSSGGALVWSGCCLKTWSTTQNVVALSSGEAEYYAALKGAREAMGMQAVCEDIGINVKIVLHTDSSACLGICGRAGIGKIKHMDVVLLWLQGAVRSGRIGIRKIGGKINPADLMTKYLGRAAIDAHLRVLRIHAEAGRPTGVDKV